MKFSEYRSQALRAIWAIFSMDVATRHKDFKAWRMDDICASYWRSRDDVFNEQCVEELRDYLVSELKQERVTC